MMTGHALSVANRGLRVRTGKISNVADNVGAIERSRKMALESTIILIVVAGTVLTVAALLVVILEVTRPIK